MGKGTTLAGTVGLLSLLHGLHPKILKEFPLTSLLIGEGPRTVWTLGLSSALFNTLEI